MTYQNVIELGFPPTITQEQKDVVAGLKEIFNWASKLQDVRIDLKTGSGFVDFRGTINEINDLYKQMQQAVQDFNAILKQQSSTVQQATQSTQQQTKATDDNTQSLQQNAQAATQTAKSASDLKSQYDTLTGTIGQNIAQLMLSRDELSRNKQAQSDLVATLNQQGVATRQQSQQLNDLQVQEKLLTASVREQLSVINSQAKGMISAEGSYYELNAQLLTLEKSFKSLSETERESPLGQQMLKDISTTRDQLKSLDAQMGNYQRNVGNYGNAVSGAFGQTFARSVHAATEAMLGMQRGVNALAIDLPNLIQEFSDMKKAQDEITKAGGEGLTMSQLISKAFNLQTIAIQLGVMALVRYGPEFIEWVAKANKGVDASNDFAEAQKEISKETNSAEGDVKAYKELLQQLNSELENAYKKSADETQQITLLNNQITDGKLPMATRIDSYNKLVALYPQVLSNISQEQALTGGLAKIINEQLIPALNAQAVAQAYGAQIADLAVKKQEELAKQETLKTAAVNAKKYADELGNLAVQNSTNGRTQDAAANAYSKADDALKAYANSMSAVKLLNDQIAQKTTQQTKAYEDLSHSVLGTVSQYQQLQDKAEGLEKTLQTQTPGTSAFEKTKNDLVAVQEQMQKYQVSAKQIQKQDAQAAKEAQREEDASQKALYDIDKTYSDLKIKLTDETNKNIADAQNDSLQKELDVAKTTYQQQLSAIQKSVDDFKKTEQEKVDTAKVSASQRQQLQQQLNTKFADLQKQAGEASEALTKSYTQKVQNITDKFSDEQKVAQEQLNSTLLHLYGEDNEAAIESINSKYDKMRAALQQKGELTNELAAKIQQAQNAEIATIQAKGSSDRLNAITKGYDDEQAELLKQYNSGKINYEQYQQELVKVQQKYSQQSLQVAIDATKAQIAATTDPKLKTALEDQLAKLNLAYQQSYDKQTEMHKRASDQAKEQWLKDAQVAIDSIQSIVDNGYQAQIQAIQDLQQAQDEQFQQEIDNINNSSLSATDKARRTKVLQAEQTAADKKAQQETKKLQHDQAVFDKEMNIAKIIMNTATAIMKAYAELGPFAFPVALAIGAEGLLELAVASSVNIPAYADGTDNHPGGLAIVGEGKHAEIVQTPDGNLSVVATPTLMNLPEHSQVIPLTPELMMIPFNERMEHINTLSKIHDRQKSRERWEVAAWTVLKMKEMFNDGNSKKNINVNVQGDPFESKYYKERIQFRWGKN